MAKRIAVVLGLVLFGAGRPAWAQFSSGVDATAGGTASASTEGEADVDVAGTGHPGRFGIGVSSHARGAARNVAAIVPYDGAGPAVSVSSVAVGSASLKYFVSDRIALNLLLGFGILSGTYYPEPLGNRNNSTDGSGFVLSAGPRFLYSAVRGTNSELYVGAGLDVFYEDNTFDPQGPDNARGVTALAFVVSAPLGFEFAFPGIPALRLSAEVDLSFITASYDYHQDNGSTVDSEELGSATAIILGSPGLDFVTLAIHYYF